MKKKSLLLVTFLLTMNLCFSQKKSRIHRERAYISIDQYRNIYKKTITKKDIKNLIIKDGDSLIFISNKEFYKKGVSVPYQPKDSNFLEIYKDVVYQKYNLNKSKNKRKNFMRLWRIPIKIYFAKSLDLEYKEAIIKTSNLLSNKIDSLNISFVNDIEKSNYIIYQVDKNNSYRYEKRMSKNQYIDYFLYWKNNKIYDGKLEVNLTKFKNQSKYTNVSYINQVFFKSLGRFYESDRMSKGSVLFKKNTNRKSITKEDIEILKYHYSFGICKGTDLEKFEEQHKEAIDYYKKTGRHLRFKHID